MDTEKGHDWDTAWSDDGDNHSHACLNGCGERSEEAPHSYEWTYVDDDTCKGVCVCNAEITDAHFDPMEGWCEHQPHCERCDHDYGVKIEHEMYYDYENESIHKPKCRNCDTFFTAEAFDGATLTETER